MIGKALTKELLAKGFTVTILTRDASRISHPESGISYAEWDIKKHHIDEKAIRESDYIIHLAGAGVADQRWSAKRKQEIVDSRVDSGKLIADSLRTIPNKVKAVISISGIGWYGPDPIIPNPHPFEETDRVDGSFLGETCQKWEESITAVKSSGKRLVILRTGIVLSKEGGALTEFARPLKFGVAAILGNGKQIISWIHIDDLVRIFIEAIEKDSMQGIYNAVAPNPVSNKEFTLQLAKIKKGRMFVPLHVPSFILKIVLGELSVEVLKSATASSAKLSVEGFTFLYPTSQQALKQLFSSV